MAANQAANFVVKAQDQATGPLGKIGKSLGSLKSTGISAFKGIAAASAVAAGALAAIAFDAVKSAAADERQTILLNAALKKRGLFTTDLNKKIQDQITSLGALGIADDEVRSGLEVGSRFIKKQSSLLKANAIAADVAAVTGQSMADVMMAIGKGAQGQTRGLVALGIKVKKGATLQDILTAATKQYGGIADELANSTSGKFAAAQVTFNESMEAFGYKLLPRVNEALDWLTTTGLPAFQSLLDAIFPIIDNLITNGVAPLIDSLDELFSYFGADSGTLVTGIQIVLQPLLSLLQAIKVVIDAIIWGMKTLGMMPANQFTTGVIDGSINGRSLGTSYGPPGNTTIVSNVNIGTKKVDTVVSDSIKRQTSTKRTK